MAETSWFLEVHVDPTWHESQGGPLTMPDDREVRRVDLEPHRCLVGRASTVRPNGPQVNLAPDAGVSRRQAELSWHEDGWWVRDLSSANGTNLRRVGEAFPGHRIERDELLDDGDELLVGSWSRLVLRRAND